MSALKTKKSSAPVEMESLWADLIEDSDFSFDIKAQTVSTDLVRAISELGLTQAAVAEKLGWSPSRVSRVLHGSANLTLRTLHEFASALGLEFDVMYRFAEQSRGPQPWESQVMLENAAVVCRKIEDLHAAAKENFTKSQSLLSRSECMLETARQLNRRAWHPKRESLPIQTAINLNVAYG